MLYFVQNLKTLINKKITEDKISEIYRLYIHVLILQQQQEIEKQQIFFFNW